MENLSADFVQFSWAIVKYLFLEERLDTVMFALNFEIIHQRHQRKCFTLSVDLL